MSKSHAVCAGGVGDYGSLLGGMSACPASGDATRPRPHQSVPRPCRNEAIRLPARQHLSSIDDGPVAGPITSRPILYILSDRCSSYPSYPVQCAANTGSFSHHSTLQFSPETSLLLCPSSENHRHRPYQAACACSGSSSSSSSSDRRPTRSHGLVCGPDRFLDRRGEYTSQTNCHQRAVRARRLLTSPGAPGAPRERGQASYKVHREAR